VFSIIDLSYFSPLVDTNSFFNIALLPTKPIELKSSHYSQNLQLTTTLPIAASCCVTFNYNFYKRKMTIQEKLCANYKNIDHFLWLI
jgi:hypothetical protein